MKKYPQSNWYNQFNFKKETEMSNLHAHLNETTTNKSLRLPEFKTCMKARPFVMRVLAMYLFLKTKDHCIVLYYM
jgi:hypothetical protein